MKYVWNKISNIGLESTYNSLTNRTIRLTNRLNFVSLTLFVLLLITTRIISLYEGSSVGMGTYRSVFMILLCLTVVFLTRKKHFKLSRFLLIYLSPFVLILFPTLVGFIEEESFIYYPYVLVVMSLFPQLLIIPQRERFFYFISLLYYFICVVTIDMVLIYFGKGHFDIIPIIQEFYVWYKIIPILLFMFLTISIYYLRSINYSFEKDVQKKNHELDLQNETLKSTIKELNKTQAKLIHSEKMAALGNLTSGIAHEINNPLNYIAGGVYLLSEALEENDVEGTFDRSHIEKASQMIESGISRATRVVQLLSVFSDNNNTKKLKLRVEDLIDGSLCFITVKTEGTIEITKDFQIENTIEVFQDQVHKVLLAIFENAVEAIHNSTKKGKIEIKSYLEDSFNKQEAIIEIWNSGPCIAEENLLRVFNPFFTTKSHKMNSGLGLTVGYNIIQEHGGEISVENNNNGVLVRIVLPLSI